ncbi:MAG: 30S ribosomal protein S3 [Patescibacteria group bacterium]|nr:30S ribosomal protein S3 [Patescibacteria group bacterium]
MSHSVHPYAHRLGIIRDWQSRWFARSGSGEYQKWLRADVLLREWLSKRLRGNFVKAIEIERGATHMRVIVKTSRPGMVIGRNGENSQKLRQDIVHFWQQRKIDPPQELKLDIEEVKNPESHAQIAGQMIVEGLERRFPFKRAARQVIEKVMANKNVQGVKVTLSGRLGGAEMSRSESFKKGNLPLQTLRADLDFAKETAYLPYGVIGVKVWIYRGEVFGKETKS